MYKRQILPLLIVLSLAACSRTVSSGDKYIYEPFKDTTLFDSYPSDEMLKYIAEGEEPSTNTNIKYSNFMVTIYNYGVYQTAIDYNHYNKEKYKLDQSYNAVIGGVDSCYLETNKDTLCLEEWLHHDINNKILRITPFTDKTDLSYKVSVSLYERIWVWRKYTNDSDIIDVQNPYYWDDEWTGISPVVELKDSANSYFKIPIIDSISDFKELKRQLALRDTMVMIQGEFLTEATIVYKNRPSMFIFEDILFRFDVFRKDVLVETKYLKITFSHGC